MADAKLGDHLRIVDGYLITADRNDAAAVRQLIEHAIVNADLGATITPPVAVARPGRRATAVYAVPLSGAVRDVLAAVRAIVVIVQGAAFEIVKTGSGYASTPPPEFNRAMRRRFISALARTLARCPCRKG